MHDETTTKFELPKKSDTQSNIVRVNFGNTPEPMPMRHSADEKTAEYVLPGTPSTRSNLLPSIAEVNLKSPWVLRLLAVLFVLILSMLML